MQCAVSCASLEAEKAVVFAYIDAVVLEVGGLICPATVRRHVGCYGYHPCVLGSLIYEK